ncbi:MAG: bifunctional helix-turn-helix transcriptional regulator/GNAT family N-acetyltransferase [Burkholderiales bacterium]
MSPSPRTTGDALAARADRVRRFNRFYTRHLGVLHERLVDSPFSLTEARLLYELAQRDAATGSDLARGLGLDTGYVSRVLSGFERDGLLSKTRSESDARVAVLTLTRAGRTAFAALDRGARRDVVKALGTLSEVRQAQLLEAMARIESLLGEPPGGIVLRDPRPGDMGWVVHRQMLLYAREYGWNEEFEALAAEIVAKFVREFDPASERCWIAERDGVGVGSVFVVREDDTTARLRMLYVDPDARGAGLGARLVDECLGFARRVGYRRMVLWTNAVLVAARRIYERAGFELIEEERHHSFGHDQIGQTWARDL